VRAAEASGLRRQLADAGAHLAGDPGFAAEAALQVDHRQRQLAQRLVAVAVGKVVAQQPQAAAQRCNVAINRFGI